MNYYVTDSPFIIITVDEICITSITISLNTHSHPSCGEVSHNVTISGNVVYPDTIGGSMYTSTIDGLQSNTLYNITVISTYNCGSRIFSKLVRTSLPNRKFQIIKLNILLVITVHYIATCYSYTMGTSGWPDTYVHTKPEGCRPEG